MTWFERVKTRSNLNFQARLAWQTAGWAGTVLLRKKFHFDPYRRFYSSIFRGKLGP